MFLTEHSGNPFDKDLDRLLRKVLKGDKRAQSRFYDEHSPLVMGVCIRYLKDRDRASDAFQEAFIRIFKSLGQLNDASALKGWVKRITVNVALDHLSNLKYDEEIDSDCHELSDRFYSDLLDRLSVNVILEGVNKLPEGYRVIFNMHVLDGFSHKEIANELGVTESTSRSQLTHAKKFLKRYLNELGITRYEQVI